MDVVKNHPRKVVFNGGSWFGSSCKGKIQAGTHHKLKQKKIYPLMVFKQINKNRIDLPTEMDISNEFTMGKLPVQGC